MLTAAERQRKRRENLKNHHKNNYLVRGKNGEFDVTITLAETVKELFHNNKINSDLLDLIIETSGTVFHDDPINIMYMQKEMKEYLTKDIKK